MGEGLASTTCKIHHDRPAVARCPECGEFFCDECITEHDGRLTCASCLAGSREEARETAVAKKRGVAWFQPMPIVHSILAMVLMWLIFNLFAQTLTRIPDRFHDGTIWEE